MGTQMAAKRKKIPAKWLKLFKLIPNYDVVKSAADGEWFDPAAAQKACDFFPEVLVHVKGELAGKPFYLMDWQKAFVGCLFGWMRKNGTRRFRQALLYVAKKNGKTALCAGIALYMLWYDKEMGAECYSAASSKDQASLVFQHAMRMVKKSDMLSADLTVYGAHGGGQTRSIVYSEAGSFYQAISASPEGNDGINVHFAVVDELHRHKKPDLSDLMQKSTAARTQPLVIYVTTADSDRESACNRKLKYAKQVQSNNNDPSKPGHNSSFLPMIYETSIKDDWTKELTWEKCNPGIDVIVKREFLRSECREAQDDPMLQNTFIRLCCNRVTSSSVAFFKEGQWGACAADIDMELLRGSKCWGAVDVASVEDLNSFSLWFPEHGVLLPFFWSPEESAFRRGKENIPYRVWNEEGSMTLTDGATTDYEAIKSTINECGKLYNIQQISFDKWNTSQLQTDVEKAGFTVMQFTQGIRSFTGPMKEFKRLVLSKELKHPGNACLDWNAGNLMAKVDESENIRPDKKKSSEKIDGMVTAIMAIGIAWGHKSEVSVYETRGVRHF